jgi:glyoxylase-like metal-dependent hydrolase (beta-lactamase superfamily II)
LKFTCESEEVWIVGDAILSLEWLLDWRYYWPNGYDVEEVIQTWRSVAAILAGAEVVIPGHGPAIEVTAVLLRDLIDVFPEAPYAASCPDVMATLAARELQLKARTS